jgi:hypothetical protein
MENQFTPTHTNTLDDAKKKKKKTKKGRGLNKS